MLKKLNVFFLIFKDFLKKIWFYLKKKIWYCFDEELLVYVMVVLENLCNGILLFV